MRISDWSSDVCSSDLHFVEHANAARTDGMAKALQAAVDLAGQLAIGVVEAVQYVADRAAFRRDEQILGCDEFGDGEAVVHLQHADLFARIAHTGLFISALGGDPRSEEHTSELQSLMRISYAVFCLKKKKN